MYSDIKNNENQISEKTAVLIDGFPSTQCPFVHIDKLVILADINKSRSFLNRFQSHLDVEEMRMARYPYLHSWKSVAGFYVEQKQPDANIPELRIVLNPNKLIPSQSFYQIIKNLKYPRFSQIDYAVDYPFDLSSYQFSTTVPKKSRRYYSRSGNLETSYMGERKSGNQYRIYDKAKESKLDGILWRIEHELHFGRDDDWKQIEPFVDLSINLPEYSNVSEIQDRAMLHYLASNPSEWGNLSKWYKSKYRKMINDPFSVEMKALDPHPYSLYCNQKDHLTALLNTYLIEHKKRGIK